MSKNTEKTPMPLYFYLSREKIDALPKEKINPQNKEKSIEVDLFPDRKITPLRFYKNISTI